MSPSSTVSPTLHSIFHTVPVMWASTFATRLLLGFVRIRSADESAGVATTPPTSRRSARQVYKDPRPKEFFDQFHTRSRTREPDWVYEATRGGHLGAGLDVLPHPRVQAPRRSRPAAR